MRNFGKHQAERPEGLDSRAGDPEGLHSHAGGSERLDSRAGCPQGLDSPHDDLHPPRNPCRVGLPHLDLPHTALGWFPPFHLAGLHSLMSRPLSDGPGLGLCDATRSGEHEMLVCHGVPGAGCTSSLF